MSARAVSAPLAQLPNALTIGRLILVPIFVTLVIAAEGGHSWPAALVFAAVWLGVAFLARFSSLAALTAALVVPVFLYFLGHGDVALLFLIMTAIIYYKHRANIERLLAGTESRIGDKE